MTRFLRIEDGGHINVDAIAELKAIDENCCEATLKDGRTVRLAGSLDQIETSLSPMVPAEPGYTLLDRNVDSNGQPTVDHQPVVGWVLKRSGALPITIGGAQPVVRREPDNAKTSGPILSSVTP